MDKTRLYVSSISSDAAELASQYGTGMEIAHYCDSTSLDDKLSALKQQVSKEIEGVGKRTLHAPFSELYPSAIDPQIREVARNRFLQALVLAEEHGADKVIIHAGYDPHIYYPVWFKEKSILFWKDFLNCIPEGMTVCLENVLEETPSMLTEIVEAVADERVRICLDLGHANAYSPVDVETWITECAPYLSHVHVHNNDGKRDLHAALTDGNMDIKKLLAMSEELSPDATYTLELMEAGPSVKWLFDEVII